MKMSITQALAELKLLDSRIQKKVGSTSFCVGILNGSKINGTTPVDEYERGVKKDYQSITDLIARRASIKALIVASNAATLVTIGDTQMTVAEAIERKGSIGYEKSLLRQMCHQYSQAQAVITRGNEDARNKAYATLESVLGKDNAKAASKEQTDAIYNPVYEKFEHKFVDPLDIKRKIEALEASIEDFEKNVDFVLSTSNATTTIEVQ